MHVLITGANGLLGSQIYTESISRGWKATALVRRGSDRSLLPAGSNTFEGDFTREQDMERALGVLQTDAIIHAAAVVSSGRPDFQTSKKINVDGTRALLNAAHSAKVKKWVQISSMSAHQKNLAAYGHSKFLQQNLVREMFPHSTILKPSLIYGPQQRGIFYKMASLIKSLPVVPLIGGGHEPMRPVLVSDVAEVACESLILDQAEGKIYELGGPEDWTFRDVIHAMMHIMEERKPVVPLPLPLCRILAFAMEAFLETPPFTSDNLEGVEKAQPLDTKPVEQDLKFSPIPFESGFRKCLEEGLLKD